VTWQRERLVVAVEIQADRRWGQSMEMKNEGKKEEQEE